jgi:hypothetical protein
VKTRKYSNEVAHDGYRVVLAFVGSDEAGKPNPTEPKAKLTCHKGGTLVWETSFENKNMPGGAWHGFQLIQISGPFLICGIGAEVLKMDLATGKLEKRASFGNTNIRFMKKVAKSSGKITWPWQEIESNFIVQYDYYEFSTSEFASNVVLVNLDLEVIWKAELPSSDDIFCNEPQITRHLLSIGSWNGFTCSIDIGTGRINSTEYTK